MANLFIDVANIVDQESEQFEGARFLIIGQPDYGTTNIKFLVGHAALGGYLDQNGQATVDLPANAEGTWMQFQLPDYQVSAGFVMPAHSADLGDLVRAFNPLNPPAPPDPTRTSVQGYSYHEFAALTFTPVTSDMSIPKNGEWTAQILKQTFPGGIEAQNDFVSDFEGFVYLDVASTANFELDLQIDHKIGDVVFTDIRTASFRLLGAGEYTVPMNVFNSRSRVQLGTYTDSKGRTVTITADMLEQETELTLSLILKRDNGNAFTLENASMQEGKVTFYQLSAVVPNPGRGPVGPQGSPGAYELNVYRAAATSPQKPSGGSFDPTNPSNNTAPISWSFDIPTYDQSTLDLYASRAVYQPNSAGSVYTPVWSNVFEAGGHGTAGPQGPPGKDASVTKANVYPQAKAILQEGENVTITADDDAETLTVSSSGGGGTGGLTSVATAAPVSGSGVAANPVTIGNGAIAPAKLRATGSGTPSASTYYRGDGQWATPDTSSGTVNTSAPVSGDGSSGSPITINNNAIDGNKLHDNTVTSRELADNAVGSSQIAGGAVTNAKLGISSVKEANLENESVGTGELKDGAVTAQKLASGVIGQASIYPGVKDIIEVNSQRMTATADDDAQTITLNSLDDVIETEWTSLPVGFAFRIGNMTHRSSKWFVCIKAHQKASVGPDNDATNWAPVTNFAGSYNASAYYHAGVMVLYDSNSQLAFAKQNIVPSDPAPDNNSNTKWWVGTTGDISVQVSAPITGDGTTDDPIGLADGGVVTKHLDDGAVTNAKLADANITSGKLVPSQQLPAVKTGDAGNVLIVANDDAGLFETSAGGGNTKTNVYPSTKGIVKAGANIQVTANDTSEEVVIAARLPDEAAPRIYALDSRDVRQVAPPYSYHTITEGFSLDAGSAHHIVGPVSTFDYDRTKPGFAVDTNNGRRNSNGVDFTLRNSGTTTRTIQVGVGVTMANERQYGSDETLTLKVFTYGYAKPGPHPEGYLTHTKVFHFTGGYQEEFFYEFPLTYSQAPRAGEHDSYLLQLTVDTASTEVVGTTVQAVRETYTLPALGSVPTQKFTHNDARHVDTIPDWIPPELKSQIISSSRILTWSVADPDNTGTNAPNESDKADVLAPDRTFGTTDSNAKDKPFLEAAQDLSRVKLHFEGSATNGAGDVYLCSRIQGFPAAVLGNTSAAVAWSLDYTGQGVMAMQDFYLLDLSGGGVGSPSATWDANPGGPKINNVIDGIFHTAHLVAGINFTPTVTNEISIDDDELTNAAEAGLLHVMRLISGNAVAEIPLRGMPRPVPFGSGSSHRRVLGSGRVKIDSGGTGGNNTLVWVDGYRDIHGLHFTIRGSSGATQQCYISGAEIEYALYRV